MRAGDLIVAVAGRRVENIYDYTYALNALKVGQAVTVAVRRGDGETELTITPESRE
jgi:S1-C subfamily serine protease